MLLPRDTGPTFDRRFDRTKAGGVLDELQSSTHSVCCSGIASHIERDDRAESRQLAGFGTIISFDVRGDAAAADAVCTGLQLIQHATSLGAVESTIERRASVPGQEHLPPKLLRLSVGIESVADL